MDTEKDILGIGTLTQAIDNVILPELAKGTKETEIAKLLQGRYKASATGNSTNWQSSVVDRAIKSREHRVKHNQYYPFSMGKMFPFLS
jgi:hypothetical protein